MINDDSVGGDDLERDDLDAVRGIDEDRHAGRRSRRARQGLPEEILGGYSERRLEGRSEREEKRGGERERLRERKAKAHAPTLVYQGRMSHCEAREAKSSATSFSE